MSWVQADQKSRQELSDAKRSSFSCTEVLVSWVQADQKSRQELCEANSRVEQLQAELSSLQRSSQTSLEALAIEHKCTRDHLQVTTHIH